MSDLTRIARLMKEDWDRRVNHDYRFWMSDGRRDDQAMWESGERDLAILCEGLGDTAQKTAIDLGCGVGRLLKAARNRFARVVGIDVSESALKKARDLINPQGDDLQLVQGNGIDFAPIPNESADVVYSFAALTSMPTDVVANYLRDTNRVLRPDGVVRLQLYVGNEQQVRKIDTLHLRCYRRECVERAMIKAGFAVEWMKELVLPFQVSFAELGIEAVIVSLRKVGACQATSEEISSELLPGGESASEEGEGDGQLEYWMTMNYAKELAAEGDMDQAQKTLDYALAFNKTAAIDVQDLMDQITQKASQKADAVDVATSPSLGVVGNSEVFARNMKALEDRFPSVAELITKTQTPSAPAVEVRTTAEGPILFVDGQCVDHPQKPVSSGVVWAQRMLNEGRFQDCNHVVVYGFGCGYHIEAMIEQSKKSVSVIEPQVSVFQAALQNRDLTKCLGSLKNLIVGQAESIDCFDERSELATRPQTQVISLDYSHKVRNKFYGARGITSLHPQIGVLGPIQGGTLPIMGYVGRTLTFMNQRAREIDVSGFNGGYNSVEKILNNQIFRANAHGHFVEMLGQLVLDSVTEKPVDILICMAQAPATPKVLTELRKRGVITVLWFVEDYLRFKTWQYIAPYYDFIFTIQKGECIDAIKAAGCSEVHYLPTACDPITHCPMDLSLEDKARWGSNVSFLGAGYHNRQQMFASLAHYPFKIWGTEWPECRPFDRLVQEKGRRLTPDEYIKIFNSSEINLNLHSSTERDGIDPGGDFLNPRTFELASCGAFQLVDPRLYLGDVFTPGKDIITFDSTEDLKSKINYYLEHEDERKAIAERSRQTVLAGHTYFHRLKEMLSVIYASRFEHLKRREDASPWKKILDRSKPYSELHEMCEKAFLRGEEPGLDGMVAGVVTGNGSLSDTEQKLLFLYHVSKQIIRMKQEENGG